MGAINAHPAAVSGTPFFLPKATGDAKSVGLHAKIIHEDMIREANEESGISVSSADSQQHLAELGELALLMSKEKSQVTKMERQAENTVQLSRWQGERQNALPRLGTFYSADANSSFAL